MITSNINEIHNKIEDLIVSLPYSQAHEVLIKSLEKIPPFKPIDSEIETHESITIITAYLGLQERVFIYNTSSKEEKEKHTDRLYKIIDSAIKDQLQWSINSVHVPLKSVKNLFSSIDSK